jgi:uncharacterized protein (DUF736 family)
MCGVAPQNRGKTSRQAPQLHVTPRCAKSAFCGAPLNADIGAGRARRSSEGRDYLSVKLDDPSFNAPIYANLFADGDGETFALVWSRGRTQSGD